MKKITFALALVFGLILSGYSQFLPCTATISQDPNNPGSISFSGPTTNYSPNLFNYFWSFGDGANNVPGVSGMHSYAAQGSYDVCLSVVEVSTGAIVCTSCDTVLINTTQQNCAITYLPIPGNPPTYVFSTTVDSLSGYFANWDFGDGVAMTGNFITHTYSQPGTYVVTATVMGNGAVYCTSNAVIMVDPVQGNCSFTALSDGVNNYSFNSDGVYPGNTQYTMDFGDNTNETNFTGQFNHTYTTPGIFTTCMTVTEPGLPNCMSCQDIVVNQNPIDSLGCYVGIMQNPSNAAQYTFSLGAPAILAMWTITSANGVMDTIMLSNSSEMTYDFPSNGLYTVSIQNIDPAAGVQCTNYVQIVVNIVPPPSTNCQADFYATTSPLNGFFIDMSTNINPTTTSYFWTFGDGSTSTNRFPFHTYSTGGIYDVTLIINNGACTDTANQYVNILGVDTIPVVDTCSAYFIVTQTNPYSVEVVNLSSGSNLGFVWSFGNGINSNGGFPQVNVPFSSNYYFCLTVTGANNCVSTYCDSLAFDSAGVIMRTTDLLHINVLSAEEITGFVVTGIDNKKDISTASSYPNPFQNSFTIDNSKGEFTNYSVQSIDGRIMTEGNMISKLEVVEAEQWSSGIYILQLKNSNGSISSLKLIKR